MSVCERWHKWARACLAVWQLSGLAAQPCLSAHPYDIIWHWSSCLPSPPFRLPFSSHCPPLLCFQPAVDGEQRWSVPSTPFVSCFSGYVRPDAGRSYLPARHFHSFFKRFPLSTHRLCPLVFPLHSLCCFVPFRYPRLFLFTALCAALILFLSLTPIVNFNLRVGLNGTIRERSMLLIWMLVHLDLNVPHPRRKGGRGKSFFSSTGKYINKQVRVLYTQTPGRLSHKSLIKHLNARDRKYLQIFTLRQSQ